MQRSPPRRGQVLVYTCPSGSWIHPAALAAVVVVVLLALAAYARLAGPPPREPAPRARLRIVSPAPPAPVARAPVWPRIWRAGTDPVEGLVTSSHGRLRLTILEKTLQNGTRGRPLAVAIEPYGLLIEGSTPWPVHALGAVTERAVQGGATVKFHVALHGPGLVRTLADAPFFDAPDEPRTRLVFAGEPVPHVERPGFAGQPALHEILKAWLRPDGTARLAPNQALLLWEFTSEFHSPAADFQDVVALVELVR